MGSMASVVRNAGMLSKDELDREAVRLAGIVQQNTAALIAHLAEMRGRRVALELGYSGLFAYCMQRLGMSEPQAALRCRVAGVCLEYPAVLESLAANRMSLTVAGKIAPHLTAENAEEFIRAAEGMTKREVEVHLVGIKPKSTIGSGYRRTPDTQEPLAGAGTLSLPETDRSDPSGDAKDEATSTATPSRRSKPARSNATPPRRGRIEPTGPNRCSFHFESTSSLAEKIERLAQVLGVVDTKGQLQALIETAVDIALEKKDPRQKYERRMAREAKKAQAAEESAPPTPPRLDAVTGAEIESAPPTRHVPADVRGRVLANADYQCEFVGPDGRRCDRRVTLQIDHVHPFAKSGHGSEGPHVESNLRCLCQAHNLLHAERHYGRDFIQRQVQRN